MNDLSKYYDKKLLSLLKPFGHIPPYKKGRLSKLLCFLFGHKEIKLDKAYTKHPFSEYNSYKTYCKRCDEPLKRVELTKSNTKTYKWRRYDAISKYTMRKIMDEEVPFTTA